MKLFRMVCCAGTLVGVMALGIAGCSSDDDDKKQQPAQTGGSSGAGGTGGAIDCSQASGIAECKQRAAALGTCPALGDCSCDNCCLELADCETDPGCIAIRDCALSKGCRGIGCYQAATCMDVIDANGGPTGVPASYGTVLSTCLDTAMCPLRAETRGVRGSESVPPRATECGVDVFSKCNSCRQIAGEVRRT